MNEWNDEDEDLLREQYRAQQPPLREPGQVWHIVAGKLGKQSAGKMPSGLSYAGVAAILLLGVALLAFAFGNRDGSGNLSGARSTSTPDPIAAAVINWGVTSGSPEVLLSKRVQGWELPCLGMYGNLIPSVEYGLVVLGGTFQPMAIPGWGGGTFSFNSGTPYIYAAYVYDIDNSGITEFLSSPAWPQLRRAFGGPNWPLDHPLYVDANGQPGMTAALVSGGANKKWFDQGQQLIKPQAQTVDGWKVTLLSVYAQDNQVQIGYTITGPDKPYQTWAAKLTDLDTNTNGSTSGQAIDDIRGPSTAIETYTFPQKFGERARLRFTIDAIPLAAPSQFNTCSPPLTPITELIWSTPVLTPAQPAPTQEPETVGPFSFDVDLPVTHLPTPIPQPTPIPTEPRPLPPTVLPAAEPSDVAEPLATPSK